VHLKVVETSVHFFKRCGIIKLAGTLGTLTMSFERAGPARNRFELGAAIRRKLREEL
jgi:hypothetical protein